MFTDVDLLLSNAIAVIDEALDRKAYGVTRKFAPLFSGGHDSYCACFVASQHKRFDGNIYHINTGIGSKATRAFVEQVCKEEGWKLNVLKSRYSYEDIVKMSGFLGPGAHKWAYLRLKDMCVDDLTRVARRHHQTMLVTGCRSDESIRRMGHVSAIRHGQLVKERIRKFQRLWVNPCFNWTTENQIDFMNYHMMPRNPVKESLLGMSGECFCGAFAQPGELDMIREICPDVAAEIDRLAEIARGAGKPCVYGNRPTGKIEVLETGPLCTTCDLRARQAGITVVNR